MPPKLVSVEAVQTRTDTQAQKSPNTKSKLDIWMPLYVAEFLADTAHLDARATGAYLLMLFHCWRKGALPNDLNAITRIARLSEQDTCIAQALLDEFFMQSTSTDLWHNGRVDREREKTVKARMAASERGAKAANTRWNGTSNP